MNHLTIIEQRHSVEFVDLGGQESFVALVVNLFHLGVEGDHIFSTVHT